jgi:hypothetical protein
MQEKCTRSVCAKTGKCGLNRERPVEGRHGRTEVGSWSRSDADDTEPERGASSAIFFVQFNHNNKNKHILFLEALIQKCRRRLHRCRSRASHNLDKHSKASRNQASPC